MANGPKSKNQSLLKQWQKQKSAGAGSKYRNQRIRTPDGVFDSKREYRRWEALKLAEKAGLICNLKRSVTFYFGSEGGGWVKYDSGRRLYYKADFVYEETVWKSDGRANDIVRTVVEDSKGGVRTRDYLIKKALMKYFHQIEILES